MRSGTSTTLVTAVVAMIAAATIMLVPPYQGLVDLPSHIAHFNFSLGGGRPPSVARYISYHWRLIPTLGTEIIVYLLGQVMSLALATKLTVAAIPAINAGGMIVLARVVHGRISPVTLLALPLAFSFPFTFGFLDFCFTAGLALWAAAAWIYLSRRGATRARLVFALLASPALMVSHLVGWALFGMIVVAATIADRRSWGWARAVRSTILDCLPLAWPVLVLLIQRRNNDAGVHMFFPWKDIVEWSASVLRERWIWIDVPCAAVLYAACLLPLVARRFFRFDPVLAAPAALSWAAVLLVPLEVFASVYANVRLIPYALALTLLSIQPKGPLPRWTWWLSSGFVAFCYAVALTALLLASEKIERQLGALDHIGSGTKVLSFEMEPCGRPWQPQRSRNIHLFASIRRDALTNSHFMVPGQHLLTITYPPAQYLMPSGENIVKPRDCWPRMPYDQAMKIAPVRAFDYVWLLDVPDERLPDRPDLRLLWKTRDSALYRVQ